MRGRIFRTTLLVTLVTLTVCLAVIIGLLYTFFENSYTVELKNEADYIASSVDVYGMEYLKDIDFGNLRVSYIASNGKVLYDNRADVNLMTNHGQREEVKEALQSGGGESIRLSETISEKNYYISRKLKNGDVIRVADTRMSEWALMARLMRHIVLVVILSVVLSAIFSGRLAKKVVKPINELNLSEPEKNDVYEELTPLLTRISEQNKLIGQQMEQLRLERQEFAAITSNMSEGFVVIDAKAKVLSCNVAVTNLLGTEKVSGESVYHICRKDKFIRCVESALAGKEMSVVIENRGRYISVIANPVYDQKHVIGALLLMMDVTEKEGREMLRREFTANVSHELKTPLTSVVLAAEMMKNGIVKDNDIQGFSEKIYNEAHRLIVLINDIIKLSRLDEGAGEINFEKTDCAVPVKKAVNAIKEEAEKKNIEIIENIQSVEMECVEHLIEEIAYNLLSNAVKYTPPQGKVTVELVKNERVILSVSDTGIGIPKEEQDRIFERFYRVDRSHGKTIEGTGLGLSIVKHGVLIHKGEIKLNSEVGKGSTFSIVF